MSKVLLSPAAQTDLDLIWDYTREQWGPDQADEYVLMIWRAIQRIAITPSLGRACDAIRPGYRRLVAGSHVLFYRIAEHGGTEIVRILHQRMDMDRHLE